MRATPELVWALRRAAARILDPKEQYRWSSPDKCNCGLLVRELCGLSEAELQGLRWASNFNGPWSSGSNQERCTMTHLPIAFVMETLRSVGFTPDDFSTIEYCIEDGKKSWSVIRGNLFEKPRYVHDFFLRLANQLESQLPAGTTTRTEPSIELTRTHERTQQEQPVS